MNENEYFSTSEAAKQLGVSEQTINSWIRKGKFPGAYKLDPDAKNSPYRIPATEVEIILKKRKTGPLAISNNQA